jgi:hypothetical protein
VAALLAMSEETVESACCETVLKPCWVAAASSARREETCPFTAWEMRDTASSLTF